MIGKNVCFYSKMTKKRKNDTEPIAKIILSVKIRIRKSKISKKNSKIFDNAKNGSDTQPKEMVKNLLETFLKPKLSISIENGQFHPFSGEKSRIFGENDRF